MITEFFAYFDSIETVHGLKLSMNKQNTAYCLNCDEVAVTGTPDIGWDTLIFIGEPRCFWTHGCLFKCENPNVIPDIVVFPSNGSILYADETAVSTFEGMAFTSGGSRVDKTWRIRTTTNTYLPLVVTTPTIGSSWFFTIYSNETQSVDLGNYEVYTDSTTNKRTIKQLS